MPETTIRNILARPIFDGCARLSLEVEVKTNAATVCAAPSYSDPRSSGKYEINHFPVGGVSGSIKLINSVIRDHLVGMDTQNLEEIDDLLLEIDGTHNFGNIGGNTAEATSMAVAKAAAASLNIPLFRHIAGDDAVGVPHQMPNIIGGGATLGDEGWKGRTPDIQDHIILPTGCQSTFEEMLVVSQVFHRTGTLLRDIDPAFCGGRDDEYCWIPRIDDVTALEVLQAACDEIAARHGCGFQLGLDVGAADLWDEEDQVYVYPLEGIRRTPSEHARHIADLVQRFDLFYLEDSFYEDHVDLYIEQVQQFGDEVLIAGDDLLAGSLQRLDELGGRGALNTAVIKLNMCGTVTRTSQFVQMCHSNSFATIGSCRTYDSPDDTLADLIVGWGCNTYKCGSPAGGEHAAKFNRYLRIDEQLGSAPSFNEFPGKKL
jgi:enolase